MFKLKTLIIVFLSLLVVTTSQPVLIQAETTPEVQPTIEQTVPTAVKPKYRLKKSKGRWYCVSIRTGKKVKGFKTINGKTYYFNKKTKRMVKGWKKIGKNKYYFGKNGIMQKGWTKIKNRWYYFRTNGKMVRNRKMIINGITYRFRSNGTCTRKPVTTKTTVPLPKTEIPNVTHTNGHWETRVIAEAWDETVVDTPAWNENIKIAIGTQWTQNDTGTDMTGWSNSQIDTWCNSHNCPNHCDEYDPSQPGYCANNCTGKTTYKIQTIHHDAITHIVHHNAITEKIWVND